MAKKLEPSFADLCRYMSRNTLLQIEEELQDHVIRTEEMLQKIHTYGIEQEHVMFSEMLRIVERHIQASY